MVVILHGSESSDITHRGKGWRSQPPRKICMKLAIVALGLGKVSLIMVNCAPNLVIQVPTLLFQTDLVPDGRAGE